jgi:hypothetical protein
MAQDDSSWFFMPPEAVKRLKQQAPDVLKEMEPPSWPPRGYPGAEQDAALAEKLGQLLAECVESSSEDHPYLPFVRAPEAEGDADDEAAQGDEDREEDEDDEEIHGTPRLDKRIQSGLDEVDALSGVLAGLVGKERLEAEAEDEDDDADEDEDEDDHDDEDADDDGDGAGQGDPKLVMLGMDADEIEDLRAENKNWWTDYWEKGEYEARLAAGKLMAERLTGVWLDVDDDASAKRGLASYEGVSKTGATVGVMAARLDDGVDEDD